MKKTIYVGVALVIILSITNCKSSKNVVRGSEPGTQEVILPLTGKEYQSDKEFYRSKSSGKSPDIATAKKIALNNAKAEVVGFISAKLKAVTQSYTNQRSVATAQDFENKFENLTTEVVSQQLIDTKVIGEKLFQTGTTYEYWVAIEVSKQAILNGIDRSLSKNQKLQIDYDKKKFEEIYNKEMEKLENEK